MAEVSVKPAQPAAAGHLTAALLGASCSASSLRRFTWVWQAHDACGMQMVYLPVSWGRIPDG